MSRHRILPVLPALLLFAAACSNTPEAPSTAEPSAAAGPGRAAAQTSAHAGNHRGHQAGRHGQRAEAGGHGHHAGAGEGAPLPSGLVGVADLPAGYHAGGHHGSPVMAGPKEPSVPAACRPIAAVLGADPQGRRTARGQARASFSKSHFGPQLSESITDYGRPSAAEAALRALQRAGSGCGRYVHSRSPVGANTYTVAPAPDAHRGHGGHSSHRGSGNVALRLTAVGDEFSGLYWDVWATASGERLVAVAFRGVPGGDNDDWHAGIAAAQAAL